MKTLRIAENLLSLDYSSSLLSVYGIHLGVFNFSDPESFHTFFGHTIYFVDIGKGFVKNALAKSF